MGTLGELGNGVNWGAAADDALKILNRFAFVLMVASISGSTPQMHRGRIQAQGGGLEKSEPWSLLKPPTQAQGLTMVQLLKAQLTPKQIKERERAFLKAERFIMNAAPGVTPTRISFYEVLGQDIRVDIEVQSGLAFVP